MTSTSDDGPVPGSAEDEALRAAALRELAEVLGEVDAGALTAEQLETILLEFNVQFGASPRVAEGRTERSGDSVADLQAAFDRLAVDARAAASDAERRICERIAELPDFGDGQRRS